MTVIAPLERRLQLVTGKGGTGKTTLVAALALAHAARGKKPLALELGHRASLVRVLGAGTIDHEPREVIPGVYAANLDVRHATESIVRRALPSRITVRALRSASVRTFLDAAPGVGEVATLDRLRHFVDETDFDPILVDGDATGHTRMLFALHDVLASLGVGGPVAALLDRIADAFASPDLAAIHLATLPTALAIEETIELWSELRRGGRVALGDVLLDRVVDATRLDLGAIVALERKLAAQGSPAASAVALLRVDHERAVRAEELRAALSAHGIRALTVPDVERATLDREALRDLGLALLEREASA